MRRQRLAQTPIDAADTLQWISGYEVAQPARWLDVYLSYLVNIRTLLCVDDYTGNLGVYFQ